MSLTTNDISLTKKKVSVTAYHRSQGQQVTFKGSLNSPPLDLSKQAIHGEKGFVIPTKSFVEIWITIVFCYNNKMFSSINKTFGCCSNENFICCP